MSFRTLMTHQVRFWDPPTAQDEYGDTADDPFTPAHPVPTVNNARPDDGWSGRLQDRGAGQEQAALRRWFVMPHLTPLERQALQVVAGTETGKVFRVESVTPVHNHRSLHHYEVNVDPAPELASRLVAP